jgi:hypothetical protein
VTKEARQSDKGGAALPVVLTAREALTRVTRARSHIAGAARRWRCRWNRRLVVVGVALLAAVVVFWSRIWPFVLAVGGWRTHRGDPP